MMLFLNFALALEVAFKAQAIRIHNRGLMPECSECLPESVRKAPGIGIDLSTSYGTVAIQNYGEDELDMWIFAPASESYVSVMSRLSQTTEVPKQSWWEQYQRKINKSLGRPATADVGVIGDHLVGIKRAIESYLGYPLGDQKVVVSVPQFPGFTREDLSDAMLYSDMHSWTDLPLPYPIMLYSLNAAYAGNRRGLCTHPEDIYKCLQEVQNGTISRETVLAISYTDEVLHTAASSIDYPFRYTNDIHKASPKLGLKHLGGSTEQQDEYWQAVREHLKIIPYIASSRGYPVTTITLLGERADDPRFQEALREAFAHPNTPMAPSAQFDNGVFLQLNRRHSNTVFKLEIATDPLYAAARGAALYARIRQEAPWDCVEPERCRQDRADNQSVSTRQDRQLVMQGQPNSNATGDEL